MGAGMKSPDGPMISIWFGNFFEPFFSDKDSVRGGIAGVASPVDLSRTSSRRSIYQLPCAPGWLASHSATFLECALPVVPSQ